LRTPPLEVPICWTHGSSRIASQNLMLRCCERVFSGREAAKRSMSAHCHHQSQTSRQEAVVANPGPQACEWRRGGETCSMVEGRRSCFSAEVFFSALPERYQDSRRTQLFRAGYSCTRCASCTRSTGVNFSVRCVEICKGTSFRIFHGVRSTWGLETHAGLTRQRVGRTSSSSSSPPPKEEEERV